MLMKFIINKDMGASYMCSFLIGIIFIELHALVPLQNKEMFVTSIVCSIILNNFFLYIYFKISIVYHYILYNT